MCFLLLERLHRLSFSPSFLGWSGAQSNPAFAFLRHDQIFPALGRNGFSPSFPNQGNNKIILERLLAGTESEKEKTKLGSVIFISGLSWADDLIIDSRYLQAFQRANQAGYSLQAGTSKSNNLIVMKNDREVGTVNYFMNNDWQAQLIPLFQQ